VAAGNHAEQRWGFDMSGGDVGNVVAGLPASDLAGACRRLWVSKWSRKVSHVDFSWNTARLQPAY